MKIKMLDTVEDSHVFYVDDSKSKRQVQLPNVLKLLKDQEYDERAYDHMKFKHKELSDEDIIKGLRSSWNRRCNKLIKLGVAAEVKDAQPAK